MISFENIEIGKFYNRKELAMLWNYEAHQAISRGVITPKNSNIIIFFVTRQKQASATQYNDFLSENFLYWEGEEKHGNDTRIINHKNKGDAIYLFFRDTHHLPFEFKGRIQLESFEIPSNNAPMKAVFKLIDMKSAEEEIKEHETEFISLLETEKKSIVLSRLGQGSYRKELLQLWNGCALTGFPMQEILIASHIKPWRDSNNSERLDENVFFFVRV